MFVYNVQGISIHTNIRDMKDLTERKRAELIQFIKTVGAPHIYTTYNFYLKETGCEELIPDGPEKPILDASKRS